MSSTVTSFSPTATPSFFFARMLSQLSTVQRPSFSRTWSELVPKLSSPHTEHRPSSMRLPKNFQPVGTS